MRQGSGPLGARKQVSLVGAHGRELFRLSLQPGREGQVLLAAARLASCRAGAGGSRGQARLEQPAGGRLVRVGDGLAVGIGAYEQAKRALIEECESAGKITLARFRDLLGISRRSAQLLLERFDADGLTRRIGDERVLRRARR